MYIGEISAFLASIIWATGATFFTLAVVNIGPYNLNFIRLNTAFGLLLCLLFFTKGSLFPHDATLSNIIWLGISGVLGLVIGDLCYFGALRLLGVRITMLFFTLAPPAAALSEWIFIKHIISFGAFCGMCIVLFGIIIVVWSRKDDNGKSSNYSFIGIILGSLSALFQGIGLTISKFGIGELDAIESTYLRMLSAAVSFSLIYLIFNKQFTKYVNKKGKIVYLYALLGTFFGPFLGVLLSMNAIKYTYSGIAQTLLSLTPITIIPFSIFVFHEKISLRSILGTIVALVGVLILIYFK